MDCNFSIFDGFDEAIIGYAEQFGKDPITLYDREKCIRLLVSRDDMSKEDAEEFFEYNVLGAYIGKGTPAFATLCNLEELY